MFAIVSLNLCTPMLIKVISGTSPASGLGQITITMLAAVHNCGAIASGLAVPHRLKDPDCRGLRLKKTPERQRNER